MIVKLWGLKKCQFGTINAPYFSRYNRESGNLILQKNRSKLVGGSLFAIIEWLQGAKFVTLVIWPVGE